MVGSLKSPDVVNPPSVEVKLPLKWTHHWSETVAHQILRKYSWQTLQSHFLKFFAPAFSTFWWAFGSFLLYVTVAHQILRKYSWQTLQSHFLKLFAPAFSTFWKAFGSFLETESKQGKKMKFSWNRCESTFHLMWKHQGFWSEDTIAQKVNPPFFHVNPPRILKWTHHRSKSEPTIFRFSYCFSLLSEPTIRLLKMNPPLKWTPQSHHA